MTKFLQRVRTMNEPSWVVLWLPNNSKLAATAVFNFEKNVNNSGLDKDICTEFYGNRYHGHAEMAT